MNDSMASLNAQALKDVRFPSHYNQGKFEVIEFIEDQNFQYHIGNAVKYLSRAGKKNPDKIIEDYEKAIWYIQRRIEVLKNPTNTIKPNDMGKTREER